MVYTIYFNPTIDKTLYFDRFVFGKTNRPQQVILDGAGKAINVSVVLSELGVENTCIGLVKANDGQLIRDRLEKHHVHYDFEVSPGSSRLNSKIFDEQEKVITEINEAGEPIDPAVLSSVQKKIELLPQQGDTVIFTGSLPQGLAADTYARLIFMLKQKGVRCVLDADGDALKAGIAQKPFLIKPNIDELAALMPLRGNKISDIAECAKMVVQSGVEIVAVSMGKDGSLITDGTDTYLAQALDVPVRSTVGAGDSMVAGMVSGMHRGIDYALQCGVAAASASVMREATRLMTKEIYDEMFAKVKITKI